MRYRRLHLGDGFVEFVVDGPVDARDLLVVHVGSPSAAVRYPGLIRAAASAGMRVASYSRPGYGSSTRRAGRTVADEATTTQLLADRLGFERFYALGWSGGGPAALAGAALLGERVKACLAIASLSPRTEAGRAWAAFWPPEQVKEWETLASGDISPLLREFEESVELFSRMTAHRLVSIGGPPDERGREHGIVEAVQVPLARSMRRAVARGYFGYLDDNVAHARDWGFRVADIRVPVIVRHGETDALVPVANGHWLAQAIPGARSVFLPNAGHGSIMLPWTELVGSLTEAGKRP